MTSWSCRYQGHISTALVIGGVDCTGPHLYTIYPHGSVDKCPFVTMGSGSLAAMSIFEHGYTENMKCVDRSRKKMRRRASPAAIVHYR